MHIHNNSLLHLCLINLLSLSSNITHCTTGKERFLYCIILPHAVNASLYKLCNHCGAMTIYTRMLTTSSASQVLIDTWVGKGNLDSCYVRNQN